MINRIGIAVGIVASLLGTTAIAGSNNLTYIDQTGVGGNVASVTQNGDNNKLGASNSANRVLQNGTNNALTVVQNGGSKAGTDGSYSQLNPGIDQVGIENEIILTQTGSHLYSVQQSAVSGSALASNKLTLTQSGNHVATRMVQTYTGNGTGAQPGNTITISQTGSTFQKSVVGLTDGQFRYPAEYLAYFPTALTGDQPGSHQIFGGVVQSGYDNSVGITQVGAQHQVASVLQQGARNELTVSQSGGNGNVLTFARSFGNDNLIVATQSGANNSIFQIDQAGDDNSATVSQTGGNGNMVNHIDQDGSHNTATLTFTGSNNGASGGVLGDFDSAFDDRGLLQGDIVQNNTGALDNLITYTVTGNSNLFAFKQDGTGNTASGVVNGSSNAVAVLQVGTSNVTSFTQSGSSNTASISQ